MQGIVIRKIDRSIVTVVKDVTQVTGNNIFGLSGSAEGINLDEAEIVVVDSEEEFVRGNALSVHVVDHKAEFYKQSSEEIIEALTQQLAKVNGNLGGFIDQYYIDNPDKA